MLMFTISSPHKKFDLNKMWGPLELVSPYEELIALITACHNDLAESRDPLLHDKWGLAFRAV